MNSKKKLMITTAAFIIVIILSVIAYNTLKNNTAAGNLNALNAASESDGTAESDSTASTNSGNTAESDSDSTSDSASGDAAKSNPVPEFSMTDADGKSVAISDLFGKPTVINFWASTCPYCIDEMPYFDEMYKEYGDDINFVMLDIVGFNGETEETGRAFIEEKGYSFPVYYDTGLEATYTLGLRSLPMTLFLDSEGNMTAMANGRIDKETIQKGIDMIQ